MHQVSPPSYFKLHQDFSTKHYRSDGKDVLLSHLCIEDIEGAKPAFLKNYSFDMHSFAA